MRAMTADQMEFVASVERSHVGPGDPRMDATVGGPDHAPDGMAAHRATILREAAAICRSFASAVRTEPGPGSPEPEFDAAMSCSGLLEKLASSVKSGEPMSLAMCGLAPGSTVVAAASEWEELRTLALAATPGPWNLDKPGCYVWGPKMEMVADRGAEDVDGAVARIRGVGGRLPIKDNLKYIAKANPATILALLAENDRLRAATKAGDAQVASNARGEHPG